MMRFLPLLSAIFVLYGCGSDSSPRSSIIENTETIVGVVTMSNLVLEQNEHKTISQNSTLILKKDY